MREFLHVSDMAASSIHVMNLDKTIYDENTEPMLSHINVGTGVDCTFVSWLKRLLRSLALPVISNGIQLNLMVRQEN